MKFNFAVLWLDLRIRFKERKVWIIALLFLLCLTVMFAMTFMGVGVFPYQMSPATTGTTALIATQSFLLMLMLILSPLSTAGRITQEREQRTLSAVLNTPLKPNDIVGGKWIGSILFVLWLMSLSFPYFAIALLWGGSNILFVFTRLGWIAGVALTSAAIAIGMSGTFKRTINSYLATGALVVFWIAVLPLIGTILLQAFHSPDAAKYQQYQKFIQLVFLSQSPFQILSQSWQPALSHWATVGIWTLLIFIFYRLAIIGLRIGTNRK